MRSCSILVNPAAMVVPDAEKQADNGANVGFRHE